MNNFFISWLWERMMLSTGPETHWRCSLNASSHWSCMWTKMPHKTKAKASTVAWRHAISKSGQALLVSVRWRFRARDMLLFFNTGKLLSLWKYTVVPLYPQYGFCGFSYPQPSAGQKQMTPLLCCHKVSSSLMLYQDASVLLRPYHRAILSSHITTEGQVLSNKVFWERPHSDNFYYNMLFQSFYLLLVTIINLLLCLIDKLSFIWGCMYTKNIVQIGLGTICGFRHPWGLECVPYG